VLSEVSERHAIEPSPEVAATSDSLSSHPKPESSVRSRKPVTIAALAVLLLVAVVLAVSYVQKPDWPTGCGIAGHPSWCAQPSAAMTNESIVALVHAYCPSLAAFPVDDVVPQPLIELDLADGETFARTSGNPSAGREEALLGRPSALSWLTRWVGGERDGVWEVRCPGNARSTPSLHLEGEQLDSTIAASQSEARQIDFRDVARQLVAATPKERAAELSFGFLECDTTSLNLTRPRVGDTFACTVEIYSPEGKGASRATYRVIGERPYFEASSS
jgi:hypothetical protein